MEENKRKHLEFIQNVISRMANNSFLIKGWSITLVSALFALAAKDADIEYSKIAFIAVPLFWSLDAYYLSLERQFRGLYANVANMQENEIDFVMNPQVYNNGGNTWFRCLFRIAVWPLYITILTVCIIFYLHSTSSHCH